MALQSPLSHIDQHMDKTPEHWFDEYSTALQEKGHESIPLLNKDTVTKHGLIRFRGLVSNQLNSEYFDKRCQFRESVDVEASSLESSHKADIKQRYPMVLRSEPYHSEWANQLIYGSTNSQQTAIDNVMAKFYCHHNSIRIADSVEIYGIWCPKESVDGDENDGDQKMDENGNDVKMQENDNDLYSPQQSTYRTLPTIHVLYWKKMECANPLLSNLKDDDISFYHENSSLIRSSLIEHIATKYTANDHLLAEYLLLHLISRTISTKSSDLLIGHFPLNIRGQFNNYKIRQLYHELAPYAMSICLNIPYLNAKRFDPVKNHQTDELEIGILQFVQDTAVVIDECLLGPGNLKDVGLKNLESLKSLIMAQQVQYDFEYHSIGFETKCNILILSKSKPLPQIQTRCYIYAECDNEENQANESNVIQSKGEEEEFTMNQYRTYLGLCRALVPKFALNSKEVTEAISDDFVELRKNDEMVTQDTLHDRLLVMRLINCSFLNQTDDDDMMNILKYMQLLEAKRAKRNKPFEQKATSKGTGTPLGTIKEM